MSLLLQIMVFLIVAAALGFALGWLVRGSRLEAARSTLGTDWQARPGQMADEPDRLRSELAKARAGPSERATAVAGQPAATARSTELESELALARQLNARHEAEAGRLEARIAELEASLVATAEPAAARVAAAPAAAAPVAAAPVGARVAGVRVAAPISGNAPPAFSQPEGEPDDLQQISGIGPGIERTLHRIGIFHFRQIAAFTPENVAWVNQHLRFKGRIEREDWIGQAKRFAGH